MNSSPLLSRFEIVTDTPGNILRLRKLIIHLAVNGSLIPDANCEVTIRTAIETIASKRQELIKLGKLKRRRVLPPIDELELPNGCSGLDRFERLENVAVLEKGPTAIQRARPGKYPLVTTGQERSSASHYDFEGRAAIIPMVSSTGHGNASLKRLHYQEGRFAVGNILCAAFPIAEELMSARFIFEYLTAFKEELLVSKMIGTANVSLTLGRIGEIPVPVVSPRVQRRVDDLMTLFDQFEEALQEREAARDQLVTASLTGINDSENEDLSRDHTRFYIHHLPPLTTRPEHIREFRKTILNLAVRGKLVSQNPNEESVSKLLSHIRAEKEELIERRLLKRGSDELDLAESEFPFDLPSSWQWIPLNRVVVFGPQNGISPKPSTRADAPKAITLTATTKGVFDARYFKHVDATIPSDSEFWLRTGDLLFQRGNTREYVGIAAYYTGEPGLFLYPDLMMKVRLSEKVSLRYVHLCAVAPHARAYFSTHASGAQATMPKINQGILLKLPIPLPPLAEQHRIVAKVDELMAICDSLESQIKAIQVEAGSMLESILFNTLNGPHSVNHIQLAIQA
jgi:type I restriction enzyme S subunit